MTLEEVEAILGGAPRAEGTRGMDGPGAMEIRTTTAESWPVGSGSTWRWSSDDARIELELARENRVVRCEVMSFFRDEESFLDKLRGWLGL